MLTFKTIHDFTDDSDSFSTLSFRTIDGTANNLINPTFNTTGSDMIRIAVPKFAPGTKNTPIDGPSPREISNVVSSGLQAETADTTGLSAMMYVCGQFIDHDLDHTLPDVTNNIDITIPPGDPNFSAGSTISLPRFITDPANGNTVNSITG